MQPQLPPQAHALSAAATADMLATQPATGLSRDEAARRLVRFGPNHLRQRKRRSPLVILLHQFRSVIVWLLAAAAAFSLVVGDHAEAIAILVVLLINGGIGFVTELRAARSMEALRQIAQARTRVRRDGMTAMVDAQDLVPGDIVILEAGDVITADLRLIRAAGLQLDESVLTGESAPVDKSTASVPADTVLAERPGMAFKGSAITRGTGEGIVTATGMQSEIGRISQLIQETGAEATPLEERLDRLGHKLVWVMLALAAMTIAAGLARGYSVTGIVQTGIALAVAAVPEGLPVVATLCLARGMWRMAARNALINRLSSVETLGATTLILTDKTGTLTENRMSVARYLLDGQDIAIAASGPIDITDAPMLGWALRIGALCNNADLDGDGSGHGAGDPMEVALLSAAYRAETVQPPGPLEADHAFDPDHKMMAQVYSDATLGDHLYAIKGAPEEVLAACTQVLGSDGPRPLDAGASASWRARNDAAAGQGLRCLALAMKRAPAPDESPYHGLVLVGLVALADPLRADVPDAIAACNSAGIGVIMITGDHAATAARIARDAGISDDGAAVIEGRELLGFDPDAISPELKARLDGTSVFARVAPATKLALVRYYQKAGHVVAMTGDGVNDAPALHKSDIGIAMGQRGTQVAREAAEMVLRDDAFSTIVAAVREGRIIFDNIRKFVVYLMSCNLSEVLVVGLAVGVGLPTPLMPLQILFLNLVTDVFPAFALGLGPGDAGVLNRPPRDPAEPVMARRHWLRVVALGAVITAATLAAFVLSLFWLKQAPAQAVTVAFVTLSLAQLWNVFNLRRPGLPLWRNDVISNPFVWGALVLCLGLLAMALWHPGLSGLLQLPSPGQDGLLLAVSASLAPLVPGLLRDALWRGRAS